ncbi:hypothetical protein [Aliihoeflea sp. 2WW]|uniref:hypothetical protein n=1 Tax=Aliihoeflea sp. 2WW TaxID=1381123 RepID=UPI000465931A|nr:hypothetical protein [Aliihoeflea sp. 2WW]
MAKIEELSVDTIKIKDGALTAFFGGAGTSVVVNAATPNPVEIFIRAAGSNVQVRRTRGNVLIGQTSGPVIAAMFVDPEPASGDTYTISGNTSPSPRIRAVVRLR